MRTLARSLALSVMIVLAGAIPAGATIGSVTWDDNTIVEGSRAEATVSVSSGIEVCLDYIGPPGITVEFTNNNDGCGVGDFAVIMTVTDAPVGTLALTLYEFNKATFEDIEGSGFTAPLLTITESTTTTSTTTSTTAAPTTTTTTTTTAAPTTTTTAAPTTTTTAAETTTTTSDSTIAETTTTTTIAETTTTTTVAATTTVATTTTMTSSTTTPTPATTTAAAGSDRPPLRSALPWISIVAGAGFLTAGLGVGLPFRRRD